MPLRILLLPLLLLGLASCAVQTTINPYQEPTPVRAGDDGPIAELRRQALAALQRRDFADAVEYLERAIRIEPRDPYSWHYLGETYHQSGDPRRCLEMVARAASYAAATPDLRDANNRLRDRCEAALGG